MPVFQWLTGWLREDMLPRLPRADPDAVPSAAQVQCTRGTTLHVLTEGNMSASSRARWHGCIAS